ncbi:hypothetical protein MCEMSEM23_01557 [Rhabdaerophilaceae bacterium]
MTRIHDFRQCIAVLVGGVGLLALSIATPATAQFRGALYYGGWRAPAYDFPYLGPDIRIPAERRLHPAMIVDELEDRGFRDLVVVARQRDTYVLEGLNPRRERLRLVVDAFDGEILERFPVRTAALTASPLPEPPMRRSTALSQQPATSGPVPASPKAPAVSQAPAPKLSLPQPPQRSTASAQAVAPRASALKPSVLNWTPINAVPVAPLE